MNIRKPLVDTTRSRPLVAALAGLDELESDGHGVHPLAGRGGTSLGVGEGEGEGQG